MRLNAKLVMVNYPNQFLTLMPGLIFQNTIKFIWAQKITATPKVAESYHLLFFVKKKA